MFPAPPVPENLPAAPPPEPPVKPSAVSPLPPPPPPVDVIGLGEFAKTESEPGVPLVAPQVPGPPVGAPAAPPAPTVTDIGLAGTDNFVPPGN